MVRLEPHEEQGMLVTLGAEFYPPAEPPQPSRKLCRSGGGRAAALRRRPADHLRAESAAGEDQEVARTKAFAQDRRWRHAAPSAA